MRRLRGVLVAVLIWAVLWVPLGIAAGAIRYARTPPYDLISDIHAPPEYPPAFPIVARSALAFIIWGAAVGLIFSLFLLGAERRRGIHELSAKQFATWGALSALGLPVVLVLIDWTQSDRIAIGWGFVAMMLVTAIFGAVCALGMLRLVKRASV